MPLLMATQCPLPTAKLCSCIPSPHPCITSPALHPPMHCSPCPNWPHVRAKCRLCPSKGATGPPRLSPAGSWCARGAAAFLGLCWQPQEPALTAGKPYINTLKIASR